MAKITNIPFERWTTDMLKDSFNLTRVPNSAVLAEWEAALGVVITEKDKVELIDIQQETADKVENWNEEELKMYCIYPLLRIVRFSVNGYTAFLQRKISTVLDNIPLSGKPEFFIAKGEKDPRKPFFFVHEYKKEGGNDADPRGQLLAAMLAAQTLNDNDKAMYGVYVVGQIWRFVVLQGRNYTISSPYFSTGMDGMTNILKMLFFIKNQLLKQ
jgi:hypothetical protein